MTKKLVYKRKGGVHNHVLKSGKRKTFFPGDTIEVDSPDELGSAINSWELVKGKKRLKAIKKAASGKKEKKSEKKVKFPKKATDGVKTKKFVKDVEIMVNDTLRQTYINPKTGKVYWMDDSGYLSPMNEDDTPLDKDNEVKSNTPSNDPPLGLKAIHIAGGWYDVVNEKTRDVINDKRLKKDAAEALINEKITEHREEEKSKLESTENMAGGKGGDTGRRRIIVDDPEGDGDKDS